MSIECEQKFGYGTPRYKICSGDTNLDHWKIDEYRKKWGLDPLFNEDKPNTDCLSKPEIISNIPILNNDYGPGTELLEIYSEAGIPPCQACYDLAQKMNNWGINGCESQIDEIVTDILPRAMMWLKDNKPWVSKFLPDILTESAAKIKIKKDVETAIERAKTSLSNRRKTYSNRGCNTCGGNLKKK